MAALPRLVLASGNAGKLREMRALLSGFGMEVVPQSEFSIPAAEETGTSFTENALIKARHAARHSGLPALADDSGIEVDVLGGRPGIRSARYAGEEASDEQNLQMLLREVARTGARQPAARYQCAIALVRDAGDPSPLLAHGTWEGVITSEPRGRNGFGYDPIFYLPERGCTAAELDPDIKNRISHRGQALDALRRQLSVPDWIA